MNEEKKPPTSHLGQSQYYEVACAGALVPEGGESHAYLVYGGPPRFCAYCRPPKTDSQFGLAERKQAGGGVFIHNVRPGKPDDHHRPVDDPRPIWVS